MNEIQWITSGHIPGNILRTLCSVLKRAGYLMMALLMVKALSGVPAYAAGNVMIKKEKLLSGHTTGNSYPRKTYPAKLFLSSSFQNLFTTHITDFTGGNLIAGYELSNDFWVGLGTELSHCALHNDNGWKLTDLKFQPVYLDFKFEIDRGRRFVPYIESAPGISFNHYDKTLLQSAGQGTDVSERGIYLYSGFGISYKLSKYFSPSLDAGFKGYKFSFNNLDVNPHGFNLKFGLVYFLHGT